jgi:phenylalanyl-tRNA synthetase beta chain
LGLRTESSQRFEKGINIEGVVAALNRAAQLIAQLGAGEVVSGVVDQYVRPAVPLTIRLRVSRVNRVLGTTLERADVQKILERLGFCCELCGTDFLLVSVPPHRVDVSEEIDLVEEVARVYGYDQIPATVPVGVLSQGQCSQERCLRELTARVMVECGLDEVITFSFTGEAAFDKLRIPQESKLREVVRIQNPLREEHRLLRTLLLPGLLETVVGNCKRRLTDLGVFEMGAVFQPTGEKSLPEEKLHLGIAVCGKEDRGWQEPPGERDFYYVKGVLEALFETLGIEDFAFVPLTDFPPLHPGRAARVLVGSQEVGFIGELHPDVQENFELPVRVCVSELDLTSVFPLARPTKVFQPIPRYPGVERDLAVVVSQDVPAAEVTRVILAAGGDLLRECRLFDVYQGPQVPPGCRSLAYSLLFQSQERTLTDEEVSEIHRNIVEALEREVGGKLR